MMQETPGADDIKDVIAHELGLPAGSVTAEMTIEELGLDSLAFAEVVVAIEKRFGRMIDTTQFAEGLDERTTVAELVIILLDAFSEPLAA